MLESLLKKLDDLQPGQSYTSSHPSMNGPNTTITAKGLNGDTGERFILMEAKVDKTTNKKDQSDETERVLDQLRSRVRDFIDHASHDLHSPLRKLGIFVDKLLEENSSSNKQEISGRISNQLQKMREIVDGFTELARAGDAPDNFVLCDLNKLVAEVSEEFRDDIEDRNITIEVSSLPLVEADYIQLKILFRNLIENAVKFGRKDVPVILKISSLPVTIEEDMRKAHKIVFEDNGTGFNPAQAELIFEPFKRMHAHSGLPGNGLGLTISKRIAENHGGTISGESDSGSGARFLLILPEQQLK
jgi:signal transduction histidine kinase